MFIASPVAYHNHNPWRSVVLLPEASFGLRVSPHRLRLCVCMTTRHPFKLGSTNLENTLVNMSIVLRVWSTVTFKVPFYLILSFSHHNWSVVHVMISKLGSKNYISTVKILINIGPDWFWSSLSFSVLSLFLYQIYLHSFCVIFSETNRL